LPAKKWATSSASAAAHFLRGKATSAPPASWKRGYTGRISKR